MICSLELENFKGVSARQRVEFAPVTLLFGANSAGKSSILQALLYLHELLERGEADVDRTHLGGDVLELGGFSRLIHHHDGDRTMMLRSEFLTPGSLNRSSRNLERFPFPDLDDEVNSAWLELFIQHRATPYHRGPVLAKVRLGLGNTTEPLLWLELGTSLREGESLFVRVNLGHPAIAEAAHEIADSWLRVALPESLQRSLLERDGFGFGDPFAMPPSLDGEGFGDGRPLPVFAVSRSRLSALPPLSEPLRVLKPGGDDPTARESEALDEIRTFLEMVIQGTSVQLASALEKSLYLGPLRTVPPRGFLFERSGRVTRWADGLAAWDLLLSDRTVLVERTNGWLVRLGAGCKLVSQQLVDARSSAEDLSSGHVDSTVRRLLLDTGTGTLVLPSEVGAGISQMVPVVVAALLEGRVPLVMIEQPEIHIHPALQVGLGDLFIEASTSRQLIVETHSEHLILRLLRRIRETTENELPDGVRAFSADELSVLYVENEPEGVRIRRLRVNERGEFQERWPKGFFAERMGELL
jgi:hypothetical protein